MDRFSLLLLEPNEIYFEDFAVTAHIDPDAKVSPKVISIFFMLRSDHLRISRSSAFQGQ